MKFKSIAILLLTTTVPVMAEPVSVNTKGMSLVLDVENGKPAQYLYFGTKLDNTELRNLQVATNGRMDAYPAYGLNTPAASAFAMRHSDGNLSTSLVATGSDVKSEGNATLTTIHLKDPIYNIKVDLKYRAYSDVDMIEAWTEIQNGEKGTVTLTTFASAMLPIRRGDVWMNHLSGSWANEAQLSQEKLQPGAFVITNNDGIRNSHTDHGEVMFSLSGKGQENVGDVIGAAIEYSGNYKLRTVTDDTEYHYFFAGINEENSEYHLRKGATFKTPALAFTYSKEGLSGASRNFHKWGRKYILAHGDQERDILLNSWEGVYFGINQQRMDQMMADIHSMGGELFVMDDGWFGKKYPRTNDKRGLGDWVVDTKKLPDGIEGLFLTRRSKLAIKGINRLVADDGTTRQRLTEHHTFQSLATAQRHVGLTMGKAMGSIDDGMLKGKTLTLMNGNRPRQSERILAEPSFHALLNFLGFLIQSIFRIGPLHLFQFKILVGILAAHGNLVADDGAHLANHTIIETVLRIVLDKHHLRSRFQDELEISRIR